MYYQIAIVPFNPQKLFLHVFLSRKYTSCEHMRNQAKVILFLIALCLVYPP